VRSSTLVKEFQNMLCKGSYIILFEKNLKEKVFPSRDYKLQLSKFIPNEANLNFV